MTPSFTSISKGEKEVMQCNEVAKGTQKNPFKSECRPEIRKKNQFRQSKQKCGSLNDNCWACSRCHAYEWCDALRDRGNYISVTQTVPPRHTGPSLDTAVAGSGQIDSWSRGYMLQQKATASASPPVMDGREQLTIILVVLPTCTSVYFISCLLLASLLHLCTLAHNTPEDQLHRTWR